MNKKTNPQFSSIISKTEQSLTNINDDHKYKKSKLIGATRDKHNWNPQFFCTESETSATTLLIKPRQNSTRTLLKVH